jgi:uncharacterized surface protein with fasciclin (FAS1) repeats
VDSRELCDAPDLNPSHDSSHFTECIQFAWPPVLELHATRGVAKLKGFTLMRSFRSLMLAALALAPAYTATPTYAQMSTSASESTVMVGGAAMYPAKNIIQNAVNSKDHTTLVAAVKAAGLVDTLMGPGPFTVFAPTNAAFDKLPPGTVETLVKPENKAALTKILTYHVVSGRLTAADLMQMIQTGHGRAMLTTVEGDQLAVKKNGGKLFVMGEKSGVAEITIPDVKQSNGVIQVVNSVLLPN